VNLWRNPDNPVDALMTAEAIREAFLSPASGAVHPLWLGDQKVGEAVQVPWAKLREQPHWMTPCAFAQGELVHALWSLQERAEWQGASVPLCPLGELGELGPDMRDIYGLRGVRQSVPHRYPAFWGHDARRRAQPATTSECLSVPFDRHTERPRDSSNTQTLTGRAQATCIVAERMWLNTQRLIAAWSTRGGAGGVVVAFAPEERGWTMTAGKCWCCG
jgi:hypothetical protein